MNSIAVSASPHVRYVLRLADTCLIHAQRLSEWCGHAPVLEEDIALTNLSLDLLGQARALLSHAGSLDGQHLDEDQMAFLRDERDYLNLTLVEQPMRRSSAHAPGGDFADTVVRNLLLAVWCACSGRRWRRWVSAIRGASATSRPGRTSSSTSSSCTTSSPRCGSSPRPG